MQRLLLACTTALVLAATACASETDDANEDTAVDVKAASERADDQTEKAPSDKGTTDTPSANGPVKPAGFATDSPLY